MSIIYDSNKEIRQLIYNGNIFTSAEFPNKDLYLENKSHN